MQWSLDFLFMNILVPDCGVFFQESPVLKLGIVEKVFLVLKKVQ